MSRQMGEDFSPNPSLQHCPSPTGVAQLLKVWLCSFKSAFEMQLQWVIPHIKKGGTGLESLK